MKKTKSILILSSALFLGGCVNLYTRAPWTNAKINEVYQCSRMAAGMSLIIAFPQMMSDNPGDGGFMWQNIFTVPLGCLCLCDAVCEAAIDTAFLPWDLYVRGKKEAKVRSVTVADTSKPYECAATNEDDDIYSLVWDEGRIRRAVEFYQSLEQKAIENPYAEEEVLYIDGKPYKVERMKEDEYGYVQPEIKTDGYIK